MLHKHGPPPPAVPPRAFRRQLASPPCTVPARTIARAVIPPSPSNDPWAASASPPVLTRSPERCCPQNHRDSPLGLKTNEQAHDSPLPCLCAHCTYPPACAQSIGDELCRLEQLGMKASPTINPPPRGKPKLLGASKQDLWVRKR